MRHNKKFNHLSRTRSHRKAMLANMASSLIEHKRITTTVAKAKALRTYVEPLITKAKEDTTHSRRVVFSYLQDKNSVSELFREVATKIADRPGGYTRILRTGNRQGDNAEMCIIELVDYNEVMLAAKEESQKPKKRRSRRGSAKKAEGDVIAEVAETAVEEAEVVEEVSNETETASEDAPATEEPKAEKDSKEAPKAEKDSAEEEKKEE